MPAILDRIRQKKPGTWAPPAPPEFPVSINLRDYPEYRAADDKLRDLKAEKQRVEARLEEVRLEIGSDRRALDDQARELIAGDAVSGPTRDELRQEYKELDRKLPIIRRAIELQKVEVGAARGRVSQEIARAVRPMYEAHLRRMMEAAVTLGELADQEEAIRVALMANGVDFTGQMPAATLRHAQLGAEANATNLWLDGLRANYGLQPNVPVRGAGALRSVKEWPNS